MSTVTMVILGVVAAIAVLVVLRLSHHLSGTHRGFKVTRDRRSGPDRRQQNLPVRKERRRHIRRQRDLAASFVQGLEHRQQQHGTPATNSARRR